MTSRSSKPAGGEHFVAQHENAKMCIRELLEEMEQIGDPVLRASLQHKLENLEECIFEQDEWARSDRHGIKLAVLGVPHAGQAELLQRFICGYVRNGNDEVGQHKNVLEHLTGTKNSTTSIGKRHKTAIQCNGMDRDLLLRTALGDPGPQVLKWADAFIVVFQNIDESSDKLVHSIYKKICRYRRKTELPCYFVQILNEGESESDAVGDLEVVRDGIGSSDPVVQYVQANPFSGKGVMPLFDGLVHTVVAAEPKTSRSRGKSNTLRRSTRMDAASAEPDPREEPILQGQFRKHHQHGGNADRWVTLLSNKLVYYGSHKEYQARKQPGKDIPLQSACVKTPMTVGNNPPKDGAHFEVRLLDNRRWKFGTTDMTEAKLWEKTIQKQIEAAIAMNLSAGAKNTASISETKKYQVLSKEERDTLAAVNGNSRCVDCSSTEVPTWASLNLTATFCIACSGVHRNLGVHISRVRSLELDDWKADHYAIMLAYGNGAVNAVYEAAVPADRQRPSPGAPSAELESWIRDKYQHKKFMIPLQGDSATNLFNVISDGGDREERLAAVAQCTTVDINRTDHNETGRSALHEAAARGDLHMVQLLLWAHADPNLVDGSGRTPLQCARDAASTNPKGCGDTAELLASQDAAFGSRLASRKSAKGKPLALSEGSSAESGPGTEVATSLEDVSDPLSGVPTGEQETTGSDKAVRETGSDVAASLIAEAAEAQGTEGDAEDDGYIQTDGLDDVQRSEIDPLSVVVEVEDQTTPIDSSGPIDTAIREPPNETTVDVNEPSEMSYVHDDNPIAIVDLESSVQNAGEDRASPEGATALGDDERLLRVTLRKEEGRKLGFSINVVDADVIVTKASPGGLAECHGIQVGMKLLELNGECCHGKAKKELTNFIASNDILAMVFSVDGGLLNEPTQVRAHETAIVNAEPLGTPEVIAVPPDPDDPRLFDPEPQSTTVDSARADVQSEPHQSLTTEDPAPRTESLTESFNDADSGSVPEPTIGASAVLTPHEAPESQGAVEATTSAALPAITPETLLAPTAPTPTVPTPAPRKIEPAPIAPAPTAIAPAPTSQKTDKEVRHIVKNLLRANGIQLWVAPYSNPDGSSCLTEAVIDDILSSLPDDVDRGQAGEAVRTLRAKSVERKERKSKK